MAVDIFSSRTMLASLEKMFEPKTFFLDKFFSNTENSMTEYVDIDVYKRGRRLAPFVRSTAEAKFVEKKGFDRKSFKPPYIKEKMITTAEDILKTPAGVHIYQGNSSPAAQAQQRLGKDIAELQDMIVRREEWMASKVLETGVITISGDGYDAEIDFGMDGTHTPTAAVLWDQATADIVGNLSAWALLNRRDSGITSNIVIMGSEACAEFLDSSQIQTLLDNRRIDVGNIAPSEVPDGSSFIGTIRVPGLTAQIFSYDEWYEDDSGTLFPMMPVKKVIVGSTNARMSRHYGAIRDLAFSGTASVRWFPKSWIVEDPSARILMLQSAPLVAPHDIDSYVCATVLS